MAVNRAYSVRGIICPYIAGNPPGVGVRLSSCWVLVLYAGRR